MIKNGYDSLVLDIISNVSLKLIAGQSPEDEIKYEILKINGLKAIFHTSKNL